ncbi:Dabb family protein [Cytophagaceae bacterium BD1B2-1]|uniref:Dabb family protein n=2 Tax=Xanthocytophaga agilis TaxID=3048010 RepID=A0AAE3R4C3_9BACT|nr:Dabb family protein [Xanthocytophaga agilis]
MKYFFLLVLSFLSFCVTTSLYSQTMKKNPKVLRHVVLFKFKDSTTPEQIKEVEKAFTTLANKIKEIKGLEFGLNNSPEGLNQGFTHCFLLTFDSEKDRDAYLPHPAHKEFGEKYVKPYLEKACVVDYWAQ